MRSNQIMTAIISLVLLGACIKDNVNKKKSAIIPLGPVRYRDSVFSSSDSNVNLVYRVAKNYANQNVALRYDFYNPHGDTAQSKPLIIFISGGGFSMVDRKFFANACKHYNAYGYATATIDYRVGYFNLYSPKSTPMDFYEAVYRATQDVRAFIRFVKANYAGGKIDTGRIILYGASAGAVTSFNAAYLVQDEVPATVNTRLGPLDGNGVYDYPGHSSTFKYVVSIAGAISDTTWIQPGSISAVCAHGISDTILQKGIGVAHEGPFSFSTYGDSCIVARLSNLNILAYLKLYDGGHDLGGNNNWMDFDRIVIALFYQYLFI